jgi:hypothetical protein
MERIRDTKRANKPGHENPDSHADVHAHVKAQGEAERSAVGVTGPVVLPGPSDGDPRRLDRETFLARLRAMADVTAVELLGDRAQHCPYIDAWFVRHASTDAAALERMARRYASISGATSAAELIDAIRLRLRMGIAYWQSGENVADELALSGLHATSAALGGEDSIAGALAGDEVHAQRVVAELGDGQPVAGATAHVHTDATASRLAARADARAFTIGSDIVLASDAPRPGSLAGDVLLAHELAHVQQQTASATTTRADSAVAERDADRAAAGTVARHLGVSAPAARSGVSTGLSLQRCKGGDKKEDSGGSATPKSGDGSATGMDASIADAAPPDAALPPGERSWIATEIKKGVATGEATGKDFKTLNAAAGQLFGQEYLVHLIEQLNNPPFAAKKFDTTKIGTKTKFAVPTSVEVPTEAELLPDTAVDAGGVAYETFKVEEDPHGASASWQPSHPTKDSGVTLGRGYDMKARKAGEIESELTAAGVDSKLAKKYRGAAGLSGEDADDWIKTNKPFDPITADQEKKLFLNEYKQVTDKTIRWIAEPSINMGNDRGYVQSGKDLKLSIDFKNMNPTILAFLVDLRFRGDLDNKAWAYIHDAVRKNDLAALQALVVDPGPHKKKFYANYIRYASRCRLVGATPKSEAEFDAAK